MSYDSAFKEIQRDPDVCNNCFRRRYQRFERNYIVDQYKGDVWVREVDGLPDQRFPNDEHNSEIPHERLTSGTRNACACGFSYGDELRPLPKSLFFEYAEHLIQRLHEDGVSFDSATYYDELSRLKSDPAEQFADDRMYMKAIASAVQVANVRSSERPATGN